MASIEELHAQLDAAMDEPSPEQDEVFGSLMRTYGETMWLAQMLEIGVTAVAALGGADDLVEFNGIVEKLRKLPMGESFKCIEKGGLADRPIIERMREVKNRRNDLAHSFFVRHLDKLLDPERHEEIQGLLEAERDAFVAIHVELEQWLGGPLLQSFDSSDMASIVQALLSPGFDPYGDI